MCDTPKLESPPLPNTNGGGAVGGVLHKKVNHGKVKGTY